MFKTLIWTHPFKCFDKVITSRVTSKRQIRYETKRRETEIFHQKVSDLIPSEGAHDSNEQNVNDASKLAGKYQKRAYRKATVAGNISSHYLSFILPLSLKLKWCCYLWELFYQSHFHPSLLQTKLLSIALYSQCFRHIVLKVWDKCDPEGQNSTTLAEQITQQQ